VSKGGIVYEWEGRRPVKRVDTAALEVGENAKVAGRWRFGRLLLIVNLAVLLLVVLLVLRKNWA
jgi:hypothetical protein